MNSNRLTLGGILDSIPFKCHWDKDLICDRELSCGGCEHQPPDDEKPNGKKPPIFVGWQLGDPYGESVFPYCPACGEMPYSVERCVFCGQRFTPDELTAEWNKPPETIRRNCPSCGGINTLVGARAKSNGHFHGTCEKCGCVIFE